MPRCLRVSCRDKWVRFMPSAFRRVPSRCRSIKLLAAAGIALLSVSPASAQESGHLSAEFLKQATPLIHWPKDLEPRNVGVFVHNEGWIDAPPAVVWKNLVDASQWLT